ncbi:hypothetical protein D1872_269630 [compost metagenome]
MLQQQLPAAQVVAVLDDDVRGAAVHAGGDQLIADMLPGFIGDFPFRPLFLEDIEVQVADQIFGQIAADKRKVRIQLADFEHFLPSFARLPAIAADLLFRRMVPAPFDILEDF